LEHLRDNLPDDVEVISVEECEVKTLGEGGSLEEQNNRMLRSNVQTIKHHAEEIGRIVTDSTKIDAWVVAKAERSATDLSDITHYLEGIKVMGEEKMANGGEVKVGDFVGNNVQGFNFEVLEVSADKLKVKDKNSGRIFETVSDNMYKSSKMAWGGKMASGGVISKYSIIVDENWDEPQRYKSFELAKKWIYENYKKHDSLELVDQFGDSIRVSKEDDKKDLDWLFADKMAQGGNTNKQEWVAIFQRNKGMGNEQKVIQCFGNTKDEAIRDAMMSRPYNGITNDYELVNIYTYSGNLPMMANGGEVGDTIDEMERTITHLQGSISTSSNIPTSEKEFILGELRKLYSNVELLYSKVDEDDDELEDDDYANGGVTGGIPNNYRGKTTEDIWNMLTEDQRIHFLLDHEEELRNMDKNKYVGGRKLISIANKKWSDLDEDVQTIFKTHTLMGQYAEGGATDNDIYYGVVDAHNNLVFQSKNEREAKNVASSYGGSIVKKYKGKGKIVKYAKGGTTKKEPTFKDKVDAISKRLKGTKVPAKLQKEYGKKYDKKESVVAAQRIAGSILAKYKKK
jgi:hypothetical protein